MSMELMVKAMKTKVGNPLRKLVLIKLADNANDQGECWPSYQHVADQCEISRRSVMAHITALCEAKLVNKEVRKGGPKGNSSNMYRLTFGSAGDSLGGCERFTRVVNDVHQGSAGDSLGGSAGDSPRTSNSFEPVTEPVTEPLPVGSASPTATGALGDVLSPRIEIPADMPGPKDQKAKTFKAWANYAFAYRRRYSVWPAWNAKAAGQLSQLVDRLGADEAHQVAAYYVGINDARLVGDCHTLNCLLAKAESYRTQWATGKQMNGRTARQIEDRQANLTAGEEAARRIRERRSNGGERNEFL